MKQLYEYMKNETQSILLSCSKQYFHEGTVSKSFMNTLTTRTEMRGHSQIYHDVSFLLYVNIQFNKGCGKIMNNIHNKYYF